MAGQGKTIFLIGFMGCGKSTVAKNLSSRYGFQRIEMDKAIEEEQGKSISDIFSQDGEEAFRNMETCFLKRLSEEKTDRPRVVSCGGGAALREENVRLMKETGVIIYLTATPQTIYERVHNSNTRPLLSGNMTVAYISALMQKRTQAYEHAASHQVSTDEKTAGDICQEILTLLHS